VDWLDLEDDYERLRWEQRKLSQKQKGSNNYETQRREVAKIKRHICRKVLDYQHKITTWLVRKYDAVFVEDLDGKGDVGAVAQRSEQTGRGVATVHHPPRLQGRPVRLSRRAGRSTRHDERMCVVWSGDGEANLD